MRAVIVLVAVSMGVLPVYQDAVDSGPLPFWKEPALLCLAEGVPTAEEAQLMSDAVMLADVAMGEDRDAAVAVMWVVLNRAKGRPIMEAITEGRAFGTMLNGEFVRSWSLNPYDRWEHPYSRNELHRLEGTAQAILLGFIPDPTNGATHFHRMGTWTPPWAPERQEWQRHGVHHFYTSVEGLPQVPAPATPTAQGT